MVRQILLVAIFIVLCLASDAQSINGHFPYSVNEGVRLFGYSGFDAYLIAKANTDEAGRFSLSYRNADLGVGYLTDASNTPYIVVLSGEDITLQGGVLSDPGSIVCTQGFDQQAFIQYAEEHPRREQALSAWDYLERIYTNDTVFSAASGAYQFILTEKARIKEEDRRFLKNLPARSYVSWYLPLRKLVSSVSVVAQYRPDEIPATIAAFRQLDYTDQRLYKSGLLKDVIDSHYWLLENMGKSLDSVFVQMNISTDAMLASLEKDEAKFNEITNYLFELLEQRSLFEASEYLALKALTQGSCTLEDDLAKQLETYRAMKKGNTAPDILFTGEFLRNGTSENSPTKLSEIESGHKLIVFGASWCPKCTEEIPQIARLYSKWKEHDVEVVYISLDDEEEDFRNFSGNFPFLSYCDFKKWESPVVENYYVFATPTMFLLDQSNTIILRPGSVHQVDAWVDWNLADDRE